MSATYSVYEAKAKFSEVINKVRRGQLVRISYRGEEVAEIRPLSKPAQDVEARVRELRALGILGPTPRPMGRLKPLAKRPGALARFLQERE
jgi:prevent-host-death family protein